MESLIPWNADEDYEVDLLNKLGVRAADTAYKFSEMKEVLHKVDDSIKFFCISAVKNDGKCEEEIDYDEGGEVVFGWSLDDEVDLPVNPFDGDTDSLPTYGEVEGDWDDVEDCCDDSLSDPKSVPASDDGIVYEGDWDEIEVDEDDDEAMTCLVFRLLNGGKR